MTDGEKHLIRYVVDGNIKNARTQAGILLRGCKAKKDEEFCASMLERLDAISAKKVFEIPFNLQELLLVEDSSEYPEEKFLLRETETKAVNTAIKLHQTAEELARRGIPYLPAIMLHGKSGCGKTELARYIAHKAGMPYVHVNAAHVMDSYLGKTQGNIARIFDFVRSHPCVLCFDEIDVFGMARGQKNDVGEMNRIVITLMQELDRLPNDLIVVGTTNRFDRLDLALIRRFPFCFEISPLSVEEAHQLAAKFFLHAQFDSNEWKDWYEEEFKDGPFPASTVVRQCTMAVVEKVLESADELLPVQV